MMAEKQLRYNSPEYLYSASSQNHSEIRRSMLTESDLRLQPLLTINERLRGREDLQEFSPSGQTESFEKRKDERLRFLVIVMRKFIQMLSKRKHP